MIGVNIFMVLDFLGYWFAGYLPVVSWVLMDKWLIINGIHFCSSRR